MADKKPMMTFKEREEARLAEELTQQIHLYGIPLALFYIFLGVVGDGIALFGSLDEKYGLVRRFGLDRIW